MTQASSESYIEPVETTLVPADNTIANKISSVPVVRSIFSWTSGLYTQAKESNDTFKQAAAYTEARVGDLTEYIAPALESDAVSESLSTVDTFISAQFDSLVEAYPAVNTPTVEVVAACTEQKDLLVEKAFVVNANVIETIAPYAEHATTLVTESLKQAAPVMDSAMDIISMEDTTGNMDGGEPL